MLPRTAETSEPTHMEGATGSVFSSAPSADGSISGFRFPETWANRMRSWTEQVRSMLAESPTLSSAHVVLRTADFALMAASALAGRPYRTDAPRLVRSRRRDLGSFARVVDCAMHQLASQRDVSVNLCLSGPFRTALAARPMDALQRGKSRAARARTGAPDKRLDSAARILS